MLYVIPERGDNMDAGNEIWYSVDEVAAKLKLHVESVRRLIRAKKLNALKFGRVLRIPQSSFNEFAKCYMLKDSDKDQRTRFSMEGIITHGNVDDKALDEVKKIWQVRELS